MIEGIAVLIIVLLEMIFGLLCLIISGVFWTAYYVCAIPFWCFLGFCETVCGMVDGFCRANTQTKITIAGVLLLAIVFAGALLSKLPYFAGQ